LAREIYIPDPNQRLPYRLRTNSNVQFFQSTIHINSDGFRGDEITRPKGRTYRIVALGLKQARMKLGEAPWSEASDWAREFSWFDA
jgi:hypothetical protein